MGNVDLTADPKIMQNHKEFIKDFVSHKTLYNVEDIQFPLYTRDIKIVDSTGRRVKLSGGNWSGAHMCRHCVDGLECRPMRDIAMDIRYKFKMNCIRLTYSLQMFYDNKPVPEKFIKANPQLKGKTGMEIFDITVQTLTDVGLMVILNNHTSSSQWCCSNDDGDGLWWSYEFPQYKFFENCEAFAKRYSNNPRVIGMDLRNQLRKAHGLDTTWGDGNPLTDWHRAATICGQKVLKIAPHWLIMVSGVNYQLDLTGVQNVPIKYSVPNKLVYTGHFYGFSWPIPSWSMVSYQDFKKKLFNSQTFVRALGYPYFLGQFGNNCKDVPWNYLIQYLKQTDIDWTYWALDGFKCEPEKDETYGVFTNQFQGARNPELLADMISVGPPHGTIIEIPKNIQNDQGVKNAVKNIYIQPETEIHAQNVQNRPNPQSNVKQQFQPTQKVQIPILTTKQPAYTAGFTGGNYIPTQQPQYIQHNYANQSNQSNNPQQYVQRPQYGQQYGQQQTYKTETTNSTQNAANHSFRPDRNSGNIVNDYLLGADKIIYFDANGKPFTK